jgi:hypothetical protein
VAHAVALDRPVEAPLHSDEPPVEVDVRPFEGRDLPDAQPRVDGRRVEDDDVIVLGSRRSKESPDLVVAPQPLVVSAEGRDLSACETSARPRATAP